MKDNKEGVLKNTAEFRESIAKSLDTYLIKLKKEGKINFRDSTEVTSVDENGLVNIKFKLRLPTSEIARLKREGLNFEIVEED